MKSFPLFFIPLVLIFSCTNDKTTKVVENKSPISIDSNNHKIETVVDTIVNTETVMDTIAKPNVDLVQNQPKAEESTPKIEDLDPKNVEKAEKLRILKEQLKNKKASKTKPIKKKIIKDDPIKKDIPISTNKPIQENKNESDLVQDITFGKPEIEFERNGYLFDTINEGDIVKYDFAFKNIGDGDLLIEDVSVTCGCTQPYFPFTPIKPGESGKITMVFNSHHKTEMQMPAITIATNISEKPYKLYMRGYVIPNE